MRSMVDVYYVHILKNSDILIYTFILVITSHEKTKTNSEFIPYLCKYNLMQLIPPNRAPPLLGGAIVYFLSQTHHPAAINIQLY